MNKYIKRISALLIFAFIFSNIISPFGTVFAKQKSTKLEKDKVEILIKYKDASKSGSIKTKVKTKLNIRKLDLIENNKRSKIELLGIDEASDIDAVIKELKSDSNVLFAQPNYKLNTKSESSADVPSDDRFSEQWGLLNDGQSIEYAQGTKGQDISAVDAWSITKGSPTVLVGVLDTGIDINHNDLKNNIYINKGEIPKNGIDDDGNGLIDDTNGWDFANNDNTVYDDSRKDMHGTHVAGIIGASQNGSGIVGVAPTAKILPLKFINDGTGYTSDAIRAIEYASKMGVKIVNCSFSGSDNNLALKEAMSASNMLFVCAAGNDGKDIAKSPVYPASFELSNVITVGATNNSGKIAALSNYGINVDVAAPGIGILSTSPENQYDYQNGTSFAAPYVAGIAALIQSIIPDMTAAQIATRIRSTATKNSDTKDKVAYGLANASAALTNNQTTSSSVVTKPNTSDGNSTTKGNVVSVCAATVSPQLLEEIHYGETGVNVATGNYSKTDTDMSVVSPGFTVNMSRTYNSKDERTTSTMGRGWTFGFEGSLKRDTNYSTNSMVIVKLPNGSSQVFIDTNRNGSSYTANDSRSTLVKNADGTHTLTTKDQYKYTFNTTATSTSGYLTQMQDRNQNSIKISVDTAGKVLSVTDTAGRQFVITYDSNNLITKISDVKGARYIKYQYTANKLLSTVSEITAEGAAPRTLSTYEYDSSNYLTKVSDGTNNVTDQITYNHTSGTHKVTQNTDRYKNTYTYTYDTTNSKTTITDASTPAATIVKKYDSAYYITESTDPEGKVSKVEYLLDTNNFNKYGEEKKITDRNGNVTEYIRDDRGNIIKIIKPDKSYEEYTFDSKNNTTIEKDEMGKCIYYIYDADGIRLLKKVQPLNGTDAYSENADQSKYSITKYVYYTDEEAQNLGYKAKGIIKQQINPIGGVIKYTYDADGNQVTVTDSEGNTTKNEYNELGWITKKVSPSGYTTTFAYDQSGRAVKSVLDKGETNRTTYDIMGRPTQEIAPNQYSPNDDGLCDSTMPEQTYRNNLVGIKYTYFPSGKIKSLTDVQGNIIEYTYDIHGNMLTEKLTDSTGEEQYTKSYTYDVMNRQKTLAFKGKSDKAAATLESYSYSTLSDGKTKKVYTKYLNDNDTATTEYTYDYENRLVEQKNPDDGKITTAYNPNGTVALTTNAMGNTTYFRYDGLNNLSEKWSPIREGEYSYQKISYDKAGNKISEKVGKDTVELYSLPYSDRFITKNYTYYLNGKVKTETDSSGMKTAYQYDAEGNLVKEDVFTSANVYNTTEYVYNHIGKVTSKTTYVNKGDLFGNKENNTEKQALTTSYTYDKNGNLITTTTPDNVTTKYTYDVLGRQISTEKQEIDENGKAVVATTSVTYDCQGNILTSTDAKGNTTINTYNERGMLTQSKKTTKNSDSTTTDYITAYYYDLAGRKISEVAPINYNSSASSYTEMNRTEYVYDSMNRLKAKIEVYKSKPTDTSFTTLVSKAYKYDQNGNVIKELDGEGYNSGTGTTLDSKISTGYGTQNTYNLAGQLETVADPVTLEGGKNYSKKYTYDGAMRKASEINSKGVITCYYYNDAGKIISTAVKKSESDPEQTVSSSTYDLVGNVIEQTDANGNKTVFQYNSLNKLKKAIYPSDSSIPESTITYQYDVMGNLMRKQDTIGTHDLYTYDNEGRVLTQTQQTADGKDKITASIAYDLNGNKRFETDANGTIKENIYDELSRLVTTKYSTTDVNNKTILHLIQYQYDKNGNELKQTNYLDNTITGSTETIYDPINRVIEKKDSYKTIQKLEYNASHIQVKSTDANGYDTVYTYDKNNRLLTTTDAEGHMTKQSYDSIGNKATDTDGKGNITTYGYDQLNRLILVTNAKGERTSYTYDLNGNKLTQTDGKGNVTTFEYNVANKPTKKIEHGGIKTVEGKITYEPNKTETYTYYSNAQISTKTDRNGKITNYKYDIHARLLSKIIDKEEVSYSYDPNGNQLAMADTTGTTTRIYDEQGRVISKSVPNLGATTFQYDILVNSKAIPELISNYTIPEGSTAEKSKDPKGNETTKVSDGAGRLVFVISEGKVTSYTYDANGNRASVVYPDGKTKETYEYYKDNRLKELTNTRADGSVMDEYSYTYDAAHNQTSKTETINGTLKGTTNYTYDSLNRLAEVLEPKKTAETSGKRTKYTFDAAGNRETEQITTSTAAGTQVKRSTYKYNEQNRLLSTTEETGDGTKKTTTYSYDPNGNLTTKSFEQSRQIDPSNPPTSKFGMYIKGQQDGATENAKPIAAGTASYEYDLWNQLVKASTGDGTSTYKYNGEGYRTEKTENGVLTRSLYEADKVILETDKNGKETARNIYGTNLISRTVTTTENGATQKDQYNYMYNGHGDVTALLGTDGTIKGTYYYDTFGTVLEKNENKGISNPYRYAGYVYDNATSLYYLNARYYDSKIARFMTEDTYTGEENDPLSLNLYTYCHNEPVSYSDPSGHWLKNDEKLNDQVKAQIIALGNAYNSAKTPEEKKKIALEAQEVRKQPGAYDTNKDTLVEIKNVDAFDKAMIAALKDGKITDAENAAAQKLIGAKVYTTSTVTQTSTGITLTTTNTKTTISKADINVETRLAQAKATNIVSTGIDVTTTTHYSAYVFYSQEWVNVANDNKEKIAAYYGLKSDDIGTAVVSNGNELKHVWNEMSNDKISAVSINTHAAHDYLFPQDVNGDSDSIGYSDITSFGNKNVNILYLLGCNAGHLDYLGNNVASAFAKIVNGGRVIASDGTNVISTKKGSFLWNNYNYRLFNSSNDKPFKNQLIKGTRDNEGWLVYQYYNNKLRVSKSMGKKLSLSQMLDKVDEVTWKK